MWLYLSEGFYYFGPGGVTRVEEIDMRDTTKKYIYLTDLFIGSVKITSVKETVLEIKKLMEENK